MLIRPLLLLDFFVILVMQNSWMFCGTARCSTGPCWQIALLYPMQPFCW
jgi:hypothetical protein